MAEEAVEKDVTSLSEHRRSCDYCLGVMRNPYSQVKLIGWPVLEFCQESCADHFMENLNRTTISLTVPIV
jgi:hypothetical protein